VAGVRPISSVCQGQMGQGHLLSVVQILHNTGWWLVSLLLVDWRLLLLLSSNCWFYLLQRAHLAITLFFIHIIQTDRQTVVEWWPA